MKNYYNIIAEKIETLPMGTHQHYLIYTERNKFVLRKYSSNYYSTDSSERLEREFTHFLHLKGAPHLHPILTKTNSLSVVVEGISYALFPFIEGEHAKPPSSQQMRNLGIEIAKMHKIGKEFSTEYNLPDRGMKYLVEDPSSVLIDLKLKFPDKSKILDYFRGVLDTGIGDMSALQTGIIHADLHLENILFNSLQPHFIDFDFLGDGFMIYDLATVLWSLITVNPENPKKLLEVLLEGYTSINNLSEEEINIIPRFIDLRNVETFIFQYKMSQNRVDENETTSNLFFSNWEKGIFGTYLPLKANLF